MTAPPDRHWSRAPAAYEAGDPSDETLVERVRRHDTLAFGALYDRYAPAVYALAAHVLGAAHAEDVVQEVFLRLWQRAAQFDPARSAFGAWFMAIARHRVLDELRRRGQARRLAAAGDVERLLARAPDPALDPHSQIWLRDAAHAVGEALALLPDDQRRVLVLGYFGGFTQSAMAELLGWPLGTVKKRVRLGLQKLRHSLGGFAPQGPDSDQDHPAPALPTPPSPLPRVTRPIAPAKREGEPEPAALSHRGARRD